MTKVISMVSEVFELILKRTDYIAFLLYMRDHETIDESNIKDLKKIVNITFTTIVPDLLKAELIGFDITNGYEKEKDSKFQFYLMQRGKVFIDRLKDVCEK
jgi:hypothetical protein